MAAADQAQNAGSWEWRDGREGPEISLDPDTHPKLFDGVLGKRIYAFFVDFLIIVLLTIVSAPLFVLVGLLSFGLLWLGFGVFAPLIWAGYFMITVGGPRSATIGMRQMGIEVRTWHGRRPGYVQAILQSVLFYLTLSLTVFVLLVPLFNRRRRCLHDFLIGTVVINSPRRLAAEPESRL